MRKTAALSCLCVLLFAAGAAADIYKCVSEEGTLTFSDRPCGPQATVAIPKTDFTVDEAIGSGGPYPAPVKYAKTIGQDIMAHAKLVGKSIFPNEYLKASDITEQSKGGAPYWTVVLYYVNREKEFNDSRIELNYSGDQEGDRIFVRLTYMRFHRFDWASTPGTLAHAKKVKRNSHYGWHVITGH